MLNSNVNQIGWYGVTIGANDAWDVEITDCAKRNPPFFLVERFQEVKKLSITK